MIKIINKAFQVGNTAYVNLEEAQRAELIACFCTGDSDAADLVMKHKAKILDILTTTASSRPRRRKINKLAVAPEAAL